MKVASPVVVDLYRLAYNAGRPVTFDELVDGIPSAYQNDANRWWVAQEHPGLVSAPEPWPLDELRKVRADWLRSYVRQMCTHKRFSCTHRDGGPAKGKPGNELVYSANKDHPPTVWEDFLVRRPVPWTPEIGATGRRHVAGIQFRAELASIQALGRDKRTDTLIAGKKQLEKALELASEALSYATPTA